ncbi:MULTISPECIES: TrkH family potassium uptake protein [unclassified Hahella]|uniref:TrkH family potassium uptake protein n=1 Tax=unclassified Hahella TaxID=2624107 RepID=UPI000FDF46CB|nr:MULTISPECIES: TrkH family potassium uptake protein [unclassified Hahella]AZZ89670.1 potassium transporter [Hahella sp. KA22]MDG9666468.1 TrkH family potassium uptake protein [Hahella sp. CR1]QAY53040.1 potassium transporter [Hahella sp. KA22]
MHYSAIAKILGVLLMLFSTTMIPPIVVSLIYEDGHMQPFLTAMCGIFLTGLLVWLPVFRQTSELRIRDGFVVTVLFWVVLSLSGAVPLYLSEHPHLSLVDAIFESVSGLTTTGATVMTGIDILPKSILWYRQQLQWLGGMGIIVLAVAILPMLGIGGMQLYRAEAPGPVKDNKLTPRITETAKALWYIYVSLTALCALLYWWAGMDAFDAIGHSFATIAIGGFSTHDASIGYFNSPLIEIICIVFMFLAGINFAMHFFAWRRRSVLVYLKDPEVVFYSLILLSVSIVTVGVLIGTSTYDPFTAIIRGVFEVVSVATTTGFATADFAHWPHLLPFLLFVVAFIGGCAGSTGGGMKVIRVLLIYKQGMREVKRIVHPNAVLQVKLGRKPVPDRVLEAVWGFFSVYMFMFVFMLMGLLATGLDQVTAWSAVGACINNLGPGLGGVALHYGELNEPAKWILCFAMLLGRLEVFTLLILFTPAFWRR